MNCFMFPGQPLTFSPAVADDPDFSHLARLTLERTSLDLATLAWQGEERSDSVKLQVFGAAMSLYRNRSLRREGVAPGMVAEHSMGIYAALSACGSIEEGDALELVNRIGVCIGAMGEKESYSLGCVVGLTLDPLSAIAANNGVFIANLNTSRHFLLSGATVGMEGAMAEALEQKAFSATLFPCDAPLHSPLMEELNPSLEEICGDYRYREPEVPMIDHIRQQPLKAGEMASFMVRELSVPVYWERSYLALRKSGVARFYEVGSGDSLKKYNRWIDSENRGG